jgi:hypothetical protein
MLQQGFCKLMCIQVAPLDLLHESEPHPLGVGAGLLKGASILTDISGRAGLQIYSCKRSIVGCALR